jgi:hypothetical protein
MDFMCPKWDFMLRLGISRGDFPSSNMAANPGTGYSFVDWKMIEVNG